MKHRFAETTPHPALSPYPRGEDASFSAAVKICVNRWPNFPGAIMAGLIVVGFCVLLLWHDPLVFWNDDYELSVLPVFADISRSWSEGHLPLLTPYSCVCSNLTGEFH